MKRLSLADWENIIRNLGEIDEEVEIVWLDSYDDEYCLCYEYELFEDGFKSEEEAQERLDNILIELRGVQNE